MLPNVLVIVPTLLYNNAKKGFLCELQELLPAVTVVL